MRMPEESRIKYYMYYYGMTRSNAVSFLVKELRLDIDPEVEAAFVRELHRKIDEAVSFMKKRQREVQQEKLMPKKKHSAKKPKKESGRCFRNRSRRG